MWKRHRALNALIGHNMSTMQMDHMGAPFHLLEMPAALRHCGELCHLVNQRVETEKGGQVNERQCRVSLCCTPEKRREHIRSETAWCLIKKKLKKIYLGFQRKFHATKLFYGSQLRQIVKHRPVIADISLLKMQMSLV